MMADMDGPAGDGPPDPAVRESPFVTIWEEPRATIRTLVATDPRRHVNALFFTSGVVGALTSIPSSFSQLALAPVWVVAIAFGVGLVSVPISHLNAWYRCWVGRLLGGVASRTAVATVAAWSSVPLIVGHGVLLLAQMALYGTEPLRAEHPTMDAAPALLQISFSLASALFTLWGLVASIVGFAEVNGFSIWRSIGTSIVALAIVTAAALAFAAVLVVVVGAPDWAQ